MHNRPEARRVVPRWRTSIVTAQTDEAKTSPSAIRRDLSAEVARKESEFISDGSVPIASELMFLASEAGLADVARKAANVIIANEAKIGGRQLIRTAKKILGTDDEERVQASSADFVKEARKHLLANYRNPVLLMDVARALTVEQHEKSALRYVRAAVAMAPQSRFVVRAAARYYLHIGEHEIAHDLLRGSPLLKSDPWVQASEIAVATVRGRTSSLVKQNVRRLLDEKRIGADQSELASALATVEYLNGGDKRAKQLFQKALIHPNDNSLAQAEWAASKLRLIVNDDALRTPLSYEANSHNAYRKLQIEEAISHALAWVDDEPFGSRSHDALCYLYSIDGQYERAQKAVEAAIKVDGKASFHLRLNLLFAKIQNGDLDDAFDELMILARLPESRTHSTQLLANAGALAYAAGEFEYARDYYERSIRIAKAKNLPDIEALARAFYARCATIAGDPNASTIVSESASKVQQLPSAGAIYVVRSLVGDGVRSRLDATASQRVRKRQWTWDMASNTLNSVE
ncbi:hypothetical protein [Pandoraea commovens]|uniref:Tetratricopeptide repeat protein n=1 Tax=Pandoraea commovens TaxID=2508289 RepID=A0ABY5QBV5_9BURK|nr:hypothetical protein [Pandoraea commovens]UVA78029.1 hypothetical protein NTU39_18345 [Pandoraea commovens]